MDINQNIKDFLKKYPDILSEVGKHFDYLNREDRYKLLTFLTSITNDLPTQEERDNIITFIFRKCAEYNREIYTSTILKDKVDDEDDDQITYTYRFSVVYEKSKPVPVVNPKIIADIAMQSPWDMPNIHTVLDHGYIWELNGIAGEIESNIDNIRVKLFCNDRENIALKREWMNQTQYQAWYRFPTRNPNTFGLLHRENNPALILDLQIDNACDKWWGENINTLKHEEWWINGEKTKEVIIPL